MEDLRALGLAVMLLIGAGTVLTALFYMATVVVPVVIVAAIIYVLYIIIKDERTG